MQQNIILYVYLIFLHPNFLWCGFIKAKQNMFNIHNFVFDFCKLNMISKQAKVYYLNNSARAEKLKTESLANV